MEGFRQDQAGAPEGRVPGGNRADDDARHREDGADGPEHAGGNFINDVGGAAPKGFVQKLGRSVEGDARRGPDQGDDRLGNHGAVEDRPALLFAGDAFGDHRRLGRVEAGDGAAGHGDEHEGPDRGGIRLRMQVGQADFGNHEAPAGEDNSPDHGHRHQDQQHAENGIQLTDQLIDRQQRRQQVIDQDDHAPDGAVDRSRRKPRQEPRRAGDEHRSAQHQQHDGKHAHDPPGGVSQIIAGQLRDGSALMAGGDHAGHIVVNGAAENRAEHDPQEDHRAEAGAHQRAEDRPCSGDIQQLDQKGLPGLHRHAVHAVIDRDRRRLAPVRGKNLFRQPAPDQEADKEHNQGKQQGNH